MDAHNEETPEEDEDDGRVGSRVSPVTYVSALRGSINHSQGGSGHRAAAAPDPPADGGGNSDGWNC